MKIIMKKQLCALLTALFLVTGAGLVYAGGNAEDTSGTQSNNQLENHFPTQQQPQSQRQQPQSQPQQPAQQIVQQPAPPPSPTTSQYFTGSGGRGMRLAVLEPMGRGLNENQEYLPAMIQGVLVSNISKYSAISVLDRVSLDRVIMETLDPFYEDDWDVITLGNIAQVGHMVTGSIIQTSAGFSLNINVIDTANGHTVASYSAPCTAAELDDHSAIHRATLELLPRVNVQLTARARNELGRASTQEEITAQAALARGVTAQRYGTEVEALSYFLQAAAIDPFLAEVETRVDMITASLTSGSMGADARNDIQWRSQWLTRLRETEAFLLQYRRENPLYCLVYSTNVEQGEINYNNETITLSLEIRTLPEPTLFNAINKLTRTIRDGLIATGRTEAWNINWPAQSITTPSPFFADPETYPVAVEILNADGTVIARQTASIRAGGWFVPEGGATLGVLAPYLHAGIRVNFPGVDVHAITDNLNVRIAAINNIPAEQAATQIGIRVLPVNEYNSLQSVMENGLHTDNLRQFTITFDRNRNILRGYSGSSASIAIPYGVTLIDENSGLRNKGISGVTIPLTVTMIGNSAFQQNILTSITIPDSVISIGYGAFQNNRLTSVFIGDDLSIGDYAFSGNLSSALRVSIGANVKMPDVTYPSIFTLWCGFAGFYNNNGRRAGLYTYTGDSGINHSWRYSGQ